MKKMIGQQVNKAYKMTVLSITALILSCYSFAQDKKIDISIDTKPDSGNNFFMQPWVWIVGGAVFLLLLVALLRGSGSKK